MDFFTKTQNLRRSAPTLSKHISFSFPHMLIRGGLMQKMPAFLRRFCAYTVPTVMAAGNAGGTTTVMISSARKITLVMWTCNQHHHVHRMAHL